MEVITVEPGLAARRFAPEPGGADRPDGADGSARPVLLVHGLSSNARLWDAVAGHLAAAGHPVVAVDLRGHGLSATLPDVEPDPTLGAAHDLAAVCDGLGWPSPVVVGQAWGGHVVLQLAAERPVHAVALVNGGWRHLADRFAALDDAWRVLAPPVFTGLTVDALHDRLRAGHPGWSAEAIEATASNLQLHLDSTVTPWLTLERHQAIVASMFAHRPRELYARVTCPVLLMVAGEPGDSAQEAAAALPRAELVVFPDGDHDLHAQQPDRVAAQILRLT